MINVKRFVLLVFLSFGANASDAVFDSKEMWLTGSNGSSFIDAQGRLVLTKVGDLAQKNYAFLKKSIEITENTSFSTQFMFSAHLDDRSSNILLGAGGINFIVHNDPDGLDISDTGALENSNFTNLVSIRFDSYSSEGSSNLYDDTVILQIDAFESNAIRKVKTTDPEEYVTRVRENRFAWIEYDGKTNLLKVFLGTDATKPLEPLITEPVDLRAILGDRAYFGFSGDTGAPSVHTSTQEILTWSFSQSEAQTEALSTDVSGDNVIDRVRYSTDPQNTYVEYLDGQSFVSIENFTLPHPFTNAKAYLLADRNDDMVKEIGIFGQNSSNGRFQLLVHDGASGQQVGIWNWPSVLSNVSFVEMGDFTLDGLNEFAINGIHNVNGTRQLIAKDGSNSQTYKTFRWPNLWTNTEIVTMSDRTGDGVPEVALYGLHRRLDKGQLFVLDGSTADKVEVYNWNRLWDNVQLVQMDDLDGDGTIDWGQFGRRKDDGRYQWLVKRGSDKKGVIRTFSWPNDLINVKPMLISDRTGDGIREVATFGTNPDSGRAFLRINDGRLPNKRIANFSWPANWEDISVSEIGDLNGDGFNEYGLVGFLKSNRSAQLIVNDGQSTTEYGRYNFGVGYTNFNVNSYLTGTNNIIDVVISGVNLNTGIRDYRILNGRNIEEFLDFETVGFTGLPNFIYIGRSVDIDAIATLANGEQSSIAEAGRWSIDQPSQANISIVKGATGILSALSSGVVNLTFTPDGATEKAITAEIEIKSISEMATEFSKSISSSVSSINGVVQSG
jgi:hypothetical protein